MTPTGGGKGYAASSATANELIRRLLLNQLARLTVITVILLLNAMAPAVQAATLTVNTTVDNIAGDNFLSLREAILLVNYRGNASAALGHNLSLAETSQISGSFGVNDTIQFATNAYGTIVLYSGALLVTNSLAVDGPGPRNLMISGNGNDVFEAGSVHLSGSITFRIASLSITNGGVGIYNENSTLTVSNCTVTGNSLGIYSYFAGSSATVEIVDTSLIGNSGGGIVNWNSVMTVVSCTLIGNLTDYYGGGIFNNTQYSSGTLTVLNCTVTGNSAYRGGGGIYNDYQSDLKIGSCTLSGNSARYGGGGVHNDGGILEIGNTILKAGVQGGNITNVSGMVISRGYNLSGDAAGGGPGTGPSGLLNATGDQRNTDPMLDPAGLQDNGGPTLTIALLAGSPAINAGDPNFIPPPDFDQRGPGFPRVVNGRIDIGAFEVQPVTSPVIARSPVSLSQSTTQGTDAPGQSFQVWNSGIGTLDYSISYDVTWLSVNPTVGSSTGNTNTHTVSYATSGLPLGTTNATITITSTNAAYSPRTVGVTLTVGCAVTPIALGQTVNGALTTTDCRSPIKGSSYYADRYSFTASAGDQVAIAASFNGFDGYLYLVGPSGNVVTNNDDCGSQAASRIPCPSGYYTLPSTGTYIIEVTSYNANATGSYTLSLSAPCNAPSITTQPANQTIASGQTATMNVAATGTAPLTYQWYQGTSGNTSSPIAGATSSTYTTPPLTSTANYWVRVSNCGGFVNSATATITVDTTPPSVPTGLTATAASCNQVNLSWNPSTDTGGSGLKGYNVYRNGAFLKQVLAPATSTFDTTVGPSTAYSYRVSAVDNANNESAQSSSASTTTPPCPDTTRPSVTSVCLTVNSTSAKLEVATDEATTAHALVTKLDDSSQAEFSDTTLSTQHTLNLEPLVRNSNYRMTLTVTDQAGNQTVLNSISSDKACNYPSSAFTFSTRRPVIFIPGLMGTHLKNVNGPRDLQTSCPTYGTFNGMWVWPNTPRMVCDVGDDFLDQLKLDSLGLNDVGGVSIQVGNAGDGLLGNERPEQYLLETISGCGLDLVDIGVYRDFLNFLTNDLHYSQMDSTLVLFSYDWRLNLTGDRIAGQLEQTIQNVLRGTGHEGVDIIAHSMGGLVAKSYLRRFPNEETKIKKLITVGTPHYGSPKAAKTLLFGEDDFLGCCISPVLSANKMKEIAQNMPAAYQLIPSEIYFNQQTPLQFGSTCVSAQPTYSGMLQILKSQFGLNGNLDTWVADHNGNNGWDSWQPGPNGPDVYLFAGYGVCTLEKIKRNLSTFCTFEEVIGCKGDGTVPLFSAAAQATLSNSKTRRYYVPDSELCAVPCGQVCSGQDATHLGLIKDNPNVWSQIRNILQDHPDVLAPGIESKPSPCVSACLQFLIASPVELHVYRVEDGAHLGPNDMGGVDREIPRATYDILDDAKSATVPAGPQYRLELRSLGIGSFHLRIRELSGGLVVNEVQFNDIPVQPTTIATADIPAQIDPSISLGLDNDGDGTADLLMSANNPPNAVQDLVVTSIRAPKKVTLSAKKPVQTKSVRVKIQNLSDHDEVIGDLGTLQRLIQLAGESLGSCPDLTPVLVPPTKGLPITVKPGKKLTVSYQLTFRRDCVNDSAANTTTDQSHADYQFRAAINHAALDAQGDTTPANNICPRSPSGTDPGCGGKKPDGTLGADVLTDVVVK